MDTKNFPLRLDPDLYELLRTTSEVRDTSMVELVRESLRSYLPTVVREEARALEVQLAKLHRLADAHPDYLAASLGEAMRAEVEVEDALEQDAELVRRPGDVTARVLDALD